MRIVQLLSTFGFAFSLCIQTSAADVITIASSALQPESCKEEPKMETTIAEDQNLRFQIVFPSEDEAREAFGKLKFHRGVINGKPLELIESQLVVQQNEDTLNIKWNQPFVVDNAHLDNATLLIIRDNECVYNFLVKKQKKGTDPPKGNEGTAETFEGYLGALASANLVGNNKFLANLTPIVNLGGVQSIIPKKGSFSWDLDVNPYLGGMIDTEDSVSFIPALMLPGRGGLILNNYLNFEVKKFTFTIMPFGFGLKFIPNLQDTNTVVIQHNLRGGVSVRYGDVFVLGVQLTQAWHNLTSESEQNFSRVFGNNITDVNYITVTGQFAFAGNTKDISNSVFFEWRNLLSRKKFTGFDNSAILTIGLRKTLELSGSSSIFSADSGDDELLDNQKARRRHRVHTLPN